MTSSSFSVPDMTYNVFSGTLNPTKSSCFQFLPLFPVFGCSSVSIGYRHLINEQQCA